MSETPKSNFMHVDWMSWCCLRCGWKPDPGYNVASYDQVQQHIRTHDALVTGNTVVMPERGPSPQLPADDPLQPIDPRDEQAEPTFSREEYLQSEVDRLALAYARLQQEKESPAMQMNIQSVMKRSDMWQERAKKAEAHVAALTPYVQHKSECDVWMWPSGVAGVSFSQPQLNPTQTCTCGLAALLPQETP